MLQSLRILQYDSPLPERFDVVNVRMERCIFDPVTFAHIQWRQFRPERARVRWACLETPRSRGNQR